MAILHWKQRLLCDKTQVLLGKTHEEKNVKEGEVNRHVEFLFLKEVVDVYALKKIYIKALYLYHTIPTFKNSRKESFRKHCVKRRKCW